MNGKLKTELKNILEQTDLKYTLLDYELLDKKVVNKELKEEIYKYQNLMELFFKEQALEIRSHKDKIASNYFKLLNEMYSCAIECNISTSTMADFRRFSIRIMELALILQSLQIKSTEIFFRKQFFYENILDIYKINFDESKITPNLESNDAQILETEIKIHSDGIFIGTGLQKVHYVSKSQPKQKKKGAKTSLAFFLKLSYKNVYNVYFHIFKDRSNNGIGGTPPELESLDPHPKKVYDEAKIINKPDIDKQTNYDHYGTPQDNDEDIESVAKSKNRLTNLQGTLFSHSDLQKKYNKYIFDKEDEITFKKKDYENNFKKAKINTAIAHLQTKANLNLDSTYTIPQISLLKHFLKKIVKKESFECKLMLSSILLGLEPRNILATLMGVFKGISIVNKEYLRIDLTTAYASIRASEIYKPTKKDVEVLIPATLLAFLMKIEESLFEKLYKFIPQKTELYGKDVKEDFETCKKSKDLQLFMQEHFSPSKIEEINQDFLNKENELLAKFLAKSRKKFDKRVVVTIRYLHLYSFHYYNNIHRESNINLLFMKNKTANIHTMLTYVATNRQLVNLTNWIKELMGLLGIDSNANGQIYKIEKKKSGSNKFIEPQKFKTVLAILLKIEMKNKHAALTIKMLYIRYVFSILFGTRKYHFSATTKEYSKRKSLLMIHEKAKDVYQSKRVIPVTVLGSHYIQYFEQLRLENGINDNAPVVVKDDGTIVWMSNKNIIKWFDAHADIIMEQLIDDEFTQINDFIRGTILDFGRHIFATHAHNYMELPQDYTDAFLNHFKRGTQDQGIFSFFDNKDYFYQVRQTIETIEKKYIPYWKEIGQ